MLFTKLSLMISQTLSFNSFAQRCMRINGVKTPRRSLTDAVTFKHDCELLRDALKGKEDMQVTHPGAKLKQTKGFLQM